MSYEAPPPNYPGMPHPPGGAGGPQYPGDHPSGTVVLVLGILGLLVCGPLGIVAWVMGNNALKEIDDSSAVYTNRGTVQAGKILGIIATILMILGIVMMGFFLGLGLFSFADLPSV